MLTIRKIWKNRFLGEQRRRSVSLPSGGFLTKGNLDIYVHKCGVQWVSGQGTRSQFWWQMVQLKVILSQARLGKIGNKVTPEVKDTSGICPHMGQAQMNRGGGTKTYILIKIFSNRILPNFPPPTSFESNNFPYHRREGVIGKIINMPQSSQLDSILHENVVFILKKMCFKFLGF